jgi:hypothetical protein
MAPAPADAMVINFDQHLTTHHALIMYLLVDTAQQPIWRGGCQANGSDADGDALPHLIGKASPVGWYITLHIPT